MNLGFKNLHPFAGLMFFVFSFVYSLASADPIALAVSFVCAAVYDLKLRKAKTVSFLFKFILPLMILITVFNGLFSHYGATVLFTAKNGIEFTLEALVYGAVSALKTASIIMWLDCFNEIITGDKIIFLFGRFSPRIALIISMVLRFIPLIRDQSAEIIKAEKGIGNGVASSGFIGKIKTVSRRLSVLVSWTMEKGIDTSDSMRARGYGLKGRTSYISFVFSLKDIAVTAVSASATVIFLISGKRFSASFNPIINIPSHDVFMIILIVFFASVLLMPVITDLREERKWSISKLKI